MEIYTERSAAFADTRNAKKLIGIRVLTPSSEVFGKVREVRLHHTTHAFEGVVVKRGSASRYIGKSYVARITNDAVTLSIEPAILVVGRPVVSSDGKRFGKVIKIQRVGHTNDIASLTVRRSLLRKAVVPASGVKQFGASIILKKTHKDACKYGA